MNRKLFAMGLLAAFWMVGCSDSSSSSGNNEGCGNGVIDGAEVCDGDQFAEGARVCPTGYNLKDGKSVTDITCSSTCEVVTTDACEAPKTCGNNVLNGAEACDGDKFAEGRKACPAGQDFVEGKSASDITCKDCLVVTEGVCEVKQDQVSCGDGVVNGTEECDGDKFADGKRVCPDGLVFAEGKSADDITCNACQVVTEGVCEVPKTCGNNELNEGEVCDGELFVEGKRVCPEGQDFVEGKSASDITCNACQVVTEGVCEEKQAQVSCGDGVVNGDEACDGDKFADGKRVCPAGQDFVEGKSADDITCDKCKVVTTGVCEEKQAKPTCGDGAVNGDEACDGDKFADGKQVCPAGQDFVEGKSAKDITCDKCKVVTTGVCEEKQAKPKCGDGNLDADEVCDTDKFATGKRVCPANYKFDTNKTEKDIVCTKECAVDTSKACVEDTQDKEECQGNVYVLCIDGKCETEDCAAKGQICGKDAKNELNCIDEPCKAEEEDKVQCVSKDIARICISKVWEVEYCKLGEVCTEDGYGCEKAPRCGNGIIDPEEPGYKKELCDPKADPVFAYSVYPAPTCNYYDENKIFVSGAPTCKCTNENESAITVETCKEATDADYINAYTLKLTSQQDLENKTKNKELIMTGEFGPSNSNYDSTSKGWSLGNWGNAAFSKYVSLEKVGNVSGNSIKVTFDVKRVNNGTSPKKMKVRILSGTKELLTSDEITLTGTDKASQSVIYRGTTKPINNVKVQFSAYGSGDGHIIISNVNVFTVTAI